MKKLYLLLLVFVIGCNPATKPVNEEAIKKEVWETVLAHNKAWTQMENLTELEKYIDENIISISPPFKTPLYGKTDYLAGYQTWIEHATVYFAREIAPQIHLFLNGTMAIVTYEIELSFEYDLVKTPDWKGRDVMTLKYENNRWLLISDVFMQYAKE